MCHQHPEAGTPAKPIEFVEVASGVAAIASPNRIVVLPKAKCASVERHFRRSAVINVDQVTWTSSFLHIRQYRLHVFEMIYGRCFRHWVHGRRSEECGH